MDLSVVMVNWNSTGLAARSISTLLATIENLDFEIIVVDNASPDGRSHVLEQISPRVRLILAGRNLGFSGANNLGAKESRGSTLLFLNPDTEVYAGAIKRMYQCLNESEQTGIAGCRLLNTDLTVQTSCIQPFPTLWNQIADIEQVRVMFPRWSGIAPLLSAPTPSTPVQAVSGACLMIRRNIFQACGGFDCGYFMYAEDVDLCYRVTQQGFQVVHAGTATVLHHGGQSSQGQAQSAFSVVLTRESIYRFMKLHYGRVYAMAYRASTALSAIIRMLVLSGMAAVVRRSSVGHSARKWWRILRWSLRLEQWAERAGAGDGQDSVLVTN